MWTWLRYRRLKKLFYIKHTYPMSLLNFKTFLNILTYTSQCPKACNKRYRNEWKRETKKQKLQLYNSAYGYCSELKTHGSVCNMVRCFSRGVVARNVQVGLNFCTKLFPKSPLPKYVDYLKLPLKYLEIWGFKNVWFGFGHPVWIKYKLNTAKILYVAIGELWKRKVGLP